VTSLEPRVDPGEQQVRIHIHLVSGDCINFRSSQMNIE